MGFILLLEPCEFGDVLELAYDVGIALPVVRQKACAAVLDAAFRIAEIPAAFVLERIERAIAEQAVEVLGRIRFVAREVFAFCVAEKGILALGGGS